MNDGVEVKTYKTNPKNNDTDGDKLFDGAEINMHKTNPLVKDTDSGSVDDFVEIKLGKNPLDPKDDLVSIDLELVFGLNSSKLTK